MKKKYIFLIAGILAVMVLCVGIYIFRTVNKSESSLGSFILNGIYGSSLTPSSSDKQSQLYNFLSSSESTRIIGPLAASISTSTGYDSLSTSSEFTAYKMIKAQCGKISNKACSSNLYLIDDMILPKCQLSAAQIKKALYAVRNDNPDIFWISNTFSCAYSGNNTVIKLNSVFSKDEQQQALENLKNKVSEIISKIPQNSTEYEAELLVHDYIIGNCKYKKTSNSVESDQKIHTSYGCLVEGSAVCEGISKAMQLLMNCLGIECRPVAGIGKSEAHAWNIVKINGEWYHIDVTWDMAEVDLGKYNYFNLTDKIIKKDHQINEELSKATRLSEDKVYNFKLPECTATAENYYEKNAVKISSLSNKDSEKSLINKIITLAAAKKPCLYIMTDSDSNFETIKKLLFNEKSCKFFNYVNAANKSLLNGYKINNRQANYVENKNQDVLIIKLNYT